MGNGASAIRRPEDEGLPVAIPPSGFVPSEAATETLKKPISKPPATSDKEDRKFNLDAIIQRVIESAEKPTGVFCVKQWELSKICHSTRELFLSQPVLLELIPPVKIVGDIHGQFTDLLRIFSTCGHPPKANYLFLGDYVDRGKQSLETLVLLLCYKLKYPEIFFLLRGNHESAAINRVYGFYDECKRRCSVKVWKTFVDLFNCLPLAATISGKIFCIHGGLSPSLHSLDTIRSITRPTEVPETGLISDLLWSDPSDDVEEWEESDRGISYCFGKKVVQSTLEKLNLDLVCRAHMVVEDGYEFFANRGLVTVFSAPNYCGEFDNLGAIMTVNPNLVCYFDLLKPLTNSASASPGGVPESGG